MAEAVLVSKKIYNFSELLEQPVLLSIKDTQFGWLYTLLETFNSGDIDLFKANFEEFSP